MREPELAAELIAMADHDLSVRTELADADELRNGYHPVMRAVHEQNSHRLLAILDELGGWPGHAIVGPESAEAAWLIAQHAIAHPTLMRRAQVLMADAVDAGQANAAHLACLVDRILAFEGKPQRYGTQLGWDDQGQFAVWPEVADDETVDGLRAEVGLPPAGERLRKLIDEEPELSRPLSSAQLADRRAGEQVFVVEVGWRARQPSSDHSR